MRHTQAEYWIGDGTFGQKNKDPASPRELEGKGLTPDEASGRKSQITGVQF